MEIAVLALLAAVVAIVVGVVLLLRRQRAADHRRSRRLGTLAERLEGLADGLGDAVERAQADSLTARAVASLDRFVELDEALARCAEAAASLPSVDLAVARVEIDGVPRVATAGPSVHGVAEPGGGDAPQTTATRYYYAADGQAPAGVGTAVAVPLEADGRRLGSLTVYGRVGAAPVPDDELDALEAISRRSAPAIGTARRPVGVKPPAGGADDAVGRARFHETLALMTASARRQGSRLTVCVIDLDDFSTVNGRIGHAAGDRVIAEIAEALGETVRPTDLVCRVGGDEFAVALPDSGRIEAESLFARLRATVAHRPAVREAQVGLSAGIAELEPDDDGVSLFERAASALRRAKDAGKGTAAWEERVPPAERETPR